MIRILSSANRVIFLRGEEFINELEKEDLISEKTLVDFHRLAKSKQNPNLKILSAKLIGNFLE